MDCGVEFYETDEAVNIPLNEDHLLYKWSQGDVYFSASRRGDALSIHISAETKKAKSKSRVALIDFVKWCFKEFDWCKYILGVISPERKTVINLAYKSGFEHYGDIMDSNGIYATIMGIKRAL